MLYLGMHAYEDGKCKPFGLKHTGEPDTCWHQIEEAIRKKWKKKDGPVPTLDMLTLMLGPDKITVMLQGDKKDAACFSNLLVPLHVPPGLMAQVHDGCKLWQGEFSGTIHLELKRHEPFWPQIEYAIADYLLMQPSDYMPESVCKKCLRQDYELDPSHLVLPKWPGDQNMQ